MIICPMCEHQQADGFECEVCGRALLSLDPLPPPPGEALEGLEQTQAAPVGAIPIQGLAELEASRFAPASVEVAADPSFEHQSQALVGAVAVERMQDIAEDRAAPVGPATVLAAGPVQCRYCGTMATEGLICSRCGMRLPRKPGAPAAAAPVKVARRREPERVRCRKCGAPAREGGKCGDCGQAVPWAEE